MPGDTATELVCPECKTTLSKGLSNEVERWSCPGCSASFPLVGGVPVLLARTAASALARGLLALRRSRRALEAQRKEMSLRPRPGEIGDGVRRAVGAAIAANLAFLDRVESLVAPAVSVNDLISELEGPSKASANAPYESFAHVGGYLRRDWSGADSDEEQLRTIARNLLDVGELQGPRDRCAVLGAGAGRLARDLTGSFERVFAFDLSVQMAASFAALRVEPTAYWTIALENSETSEAQVQGVELSLGRESAMGLSVAPERLVYAVADATKLPVAASSLAAIYAVCFTDVLPLRSLLPEVSRALRPGGVYVHFGPLGYHFPGLRDKLSVEEVRRAFIDAGFEIVAERWVEMVATNGPSAPPGRLSAVTLRNWVFSARKLPEKALRAESVVCLRRGASLQSIVTASDDRGGREEVVRVVSEGGTTHELKSERLGRVVREVDGRRPLGEIFATLGIRGDDAEETYAQLRWLVANQILGSISE